MHVTLEVVADARHDQWVTVASDDHRKPTHARPAASIFWKECGLWMHLLQVLDDRERLKERRTVVDDERRNDALRIDRLVRVIMLLALQEIDRQLLDLQAF